jgi:hypothetical protein
MDLKLRLIHARDFLKTSPRGELDLATSKQVLLKLASENAAPRQYDILIDIRQAIGDLTPTDITQLVEVMIEHRESFRSKLAILTSHGRQFDNAEFMELYAGNRGFQVGAFNDFEEAMNWLTTSNEGWRLRAADRISRR